MSPNVMNGNNVIKLAHSSEQLKVDQLMTEIREVANKPEYNCVSIAAFLGVLELLKDEYIEKVKQSENV